MGAICGKEKFDVDKNSKYSSQGEGFYRTFDQLSYWSNAKNGKQPQLEFENETENRSVASTIPINGNGRSENSSIDKGEMNKISSTDMKTTEK